MPGCYNRFRVRHSLCPIRFAPMLSRALDAASDADRDAKIEQLLLVGLDHYFAAQYEQAINVWTRVLFLDRSHARARAYIERARSALAERQRESEELLQSGVAAFQRGEAGRRARLLQAAIDGGAPADEALAVLDRLNRLEPRAASRRRRADRAARAREPPVARAVAPAAPRRLALADRTARRASSSPAPWPRRRGTGSTGARWLASGAAPRGVATVPAAAARAGAAPCRAEVSWP